MGLGKKSPTSVIACHEEAVRRLEGVYHAIERTLAIEDRSDPYRDLVVAKDNKTAHIHDWFHVKESFSHRLLETVMKDLRMRQSSQIRLLDPFCGAGTTLLSAMELDARGWQIEATGVERNPFLRFVALAKTRWPSYDTAAVADAAMLALNGIKPAEDRGVPRLSTFRRRGAFTPRALNALVEYRGKIRAAAPTQQLQLPLMLGLAASVTQTSGLRRDGRALRLDGEPDTRALPVILFERWERMLEDIARARQERQGSVQEPKVLLGDARCVSRRPLSLPTDHYDLIVYSPPYLNNIDYSEVYKLELWMLEFVRNQRDFRRLRLSTFRSHSSLRFPERYPYRKERRASRLAALVDCLSAAARGTVRDYEKPRVFNGYADDMMQALREQSKVMKPGGHAVCVVGNSLFGGDGPRFTVATDLLVAEAARAAGLYVEGLWVARSLTRRLSYDPRLRESIVVMRRSRDG